MPPTFVIVGASLAGGTAAVTLRQDGFDGEVILIGAESKPPYERPPLSKQYLRGEVPFDKALVRPTGVYEQNRIETRLSTRATRVDPAERIVDLEAVFEDVVTRFEGQGRAERAVTKRGRSIDCDFAVVGVGVEPAIDFIASSGIETHNGILVDEYCRTNVDGIYAAGDVANHYHPVFRRMRVEHWQNALQQGAVVARNMLGQRKAYEPIHRFWSDQYDVNLHYAGFHQAAEQIVVRGGLDNRHFLAFYLNQGRIDAVVALNRGKDVRRVMPLIKARGSSIRVNSRMRAWTCALSYRSMRPEMRSRRVDRGGP